MGYCRKLNRFIIKILAVDDIRIRRQLYRTVAALVIILCRSTLLILVEYLGIRLKPSGSSPCSLHLIRLLIIRTGSTVA